MAVTLKYMRDMIDAYLKVKGDKEVLSIASCHGGDEEFILHMADIYEGPIGRRPYTGRDTITLMRDPDGTAAAEPEVYAAHVDEGTKSLKDYAGLEEKLLADRSKPVMVRMSKSWDALSAMAAKGVISKETADRIWGAFVCRILTEA